MATLTREQTAQYAYAAGFRGNDLVKIVAIAGRESGYRTDAHRSDADKSRLLGDRGLWQINYVHDPGLIKAGIIKQKSDLFDPAVNARAAYYLYQRSSNTLAPWTAGPGGWTAGGDPLYGTNVQAAREAVDSASRKGLFGIPLPDWGDIGDAITDPFDIIPGNPLDAAGKAVDFLQALTHRETWIRVAQVLGGAILIALGLYVMVGQELTSLGLSAVTGGKSEALGKLAENAG